ncbi:MAG: hypothetical protein H7Y13_07485 [Sphingobacteriaceae bacterium]|nr:hypothetical protein [Sphingobacteriaceae bacterium]
MLQSLIKDLKNYQHFKKSKSSFEQYEEYLKSKCQLPSLHLVKQNNIHQCREKYNTRILVETGTFLGDMVEAQKHYFEKVISIELSKDLHLRAIERFKDDKCVTILQGDSGIVLKDLLSQINQPALFWLDGHYSAGITAKSDKNTPVLAEIEVIIKHLETHIILIDDARLFTGEEDYPTIPELCDFVLSLNPSKHIYVADDIIFITPKAKKMK